MANQIENIELSYFETIRWFKEINYIEVKNQQSQYFGDRSAVFTNGVISIRLSIDKGIFGIEIAANKNRDNFYDIQLFYLLISENNKNMTQLDKIDMKDFLLKNVDTISNLMNGKKLKNTLNKLNNLVALRIIEQFGNDIYG